MQQALRFVAHGANGLCAIIFGVISLALHWAGKFQYGMVLGGLAVLAILNIYNARAAAQSVAETAPDESLIRRKTQRQLNRKLSMTAQRIVLPSRITPFLYGWLVCVSMFAMAMFLDNDRDWFGTIFRWLSVIFLGGIIYLPIAMLPGASYIEINEEGVIFSSAFIKRYYPWFRIAGFQVIPYMRQEGIGVSFKPEYQSHTWWQSLNRKILGGFDSVIVSQHCGIDAAELLQLMRKFWDRAASEVAEATVTAPSSSASTPHSGSVPKTHSRSS